MKEKFTPKQQRFINEYLVDCNGTQSAIRAGYSKKTANEQASQLLAKLSISEKINELKKEQEKKTLITADYVILGLKKVAERCLQAKPKMIWDKEEKSYVHDTNGDGELIFEFDSAGANKAFQLLGEHLGLFKIPTQDINLHTFEHYKKELEAFKK